MYPRAARIQAPPFLRRWVLWEHPFWRSDAPWARLPPLLPNQVRGVPRVEDRNVICGILHVLQAGLRGRDALACYGPYPTRYHRFVRGSKAGVFHRIFQALASERTATGTLQMDRTHLQAHRTAVRFLQKGGLSREIGRPRGG